MWQQLSCIIQKEARDKKKKKRDVKKQNIQETDDFIIQHTILNKHVKSKDGDVQFYSSASEPAVPLWAPVVLHCISLQSITSLMQTLYQC